MTENSAICCNFLLFSWQLPRWTFFSGNFRHYEQLFKWFASKNFNFANILPCRLTQAIDYLTLSNKIDSSPRQEQYLAKTIGLGWWKQIVIESINSSDFHTLKLKLWQFLVCVCVFCVYGFRFLSWTFYTIRF